MDTKTMGKQQNELLQPLLDMINDRMDRMERKIDDNTTTTNQVLAQAKYTNGRVTKAEKAIVKLETKKGTRFEFSPAVIYLLALAGVILLVIIASLLHVDLGRIMG